MRKNVFSNMCRCNMRLYFFWLKKLKKRVLA